MSEWGDHHGHVEAGNVTQLSVSISIWMTTVRLCSLAGISLAASNVQSDETSHDGMPTTTITTLSIHYNNLTQDYSWKYFLAGSSCNNIKTLSSQQDDMKHQDMTGLFIILLCRHQISLKTLLWAVQCTVDVYGVCTLYFNRYLLGLWLPWYAKA